ncbi:MAG: CIA30 family protein [Cyanothece sp. SIO2G6]|nr:CIA30 family protein [Cyanothece sp. SIO2G6]
MATDSELSRWNLCRFLRTMAYFGAIPILSGMDWVQKPLGSHANPTVDRRQQVSEASCIFDFRQLGAESGAAGQGALQEVWGAVDDVVMGGVSSSGIALAEDSALFAGTVSTANSGGFASVRTRNFDPAIDLSAYSGIQIRVKGDGNRYKFLVRDEAQWDGVAYAHSFDTVADTWVTVDIPFEEMVPVFRARTMDATTYKVNQQQIRAFQFMLSKFEYDGQINPAFEPGQFRLYIESVCGY